MRFVNFTNPQAVWEFYTATDEQSWDHFNSHKKWENVPTWRCTERHLGLSKSSSVGFAGSDLTKFYLYLSFLIIDTSSTELRTLLNRIPHHQVKQCYKDANSVANALTGCGAKMEDGFVVFDNPHVYVLSILAQDASNYVYLRLCRAIASILDRERNTETLSSSILPILLLARLRQSQQLRFWNMYRQYMRRRRRKRHYSGCGFACGIQALLPSISILVVAGLLISPKGTWNGRISKDLSGFYSYIKCGRLASSTIVSSLFLSISMELSFQSTFMKAVNKKNSEGSRQNLGMCVTWRELVRARRVVIQYH
ncbi:hypothetical protein CMV_015103 [Castanea mollissima]|uniref:Uncharacterized protein n=1 Tax=Castanea mollissima TaxID=60419 RepID=A0A8J4R5R3_9ROSI|nr:hypothetical protein CMV_015103 [Castanea mollissima]